MPRIIAIANQKGGVGKTTTTLTLGAALAERGRSVLLIDLDPQSSLTIALGVNAADRSMHEVMGSAEPGTKAIRDIVHKVAPGFFLAPSDIALSRSEAGLIVRLGRETVLKKALDGVRADYVLIDCLPSLGILTINALVAAQQVIIPTIAEYLALRGIALFYQTLHEVRGINPDLRVLGILPTFYDSRLLHAREVLAAMRDKGLPLFDICIHRSVRFAEASLAGESILTYERTNPGAVGYRQLAEMIDEP
ncbi:MAG: AAA family ATPase [Anaerolineae bacterium]|nr:AAA family ATPase [Anaerolineae bacterium]